MAKQRNAYGRNYRSPKNSRRIEDKDGKRLIDSEVFIPNTRGTFPKGRCIYKVVKVLTPYLHRFKGYRIKVAWPNMQGHRPFSSELAPSFDKPFHLVSFGDYEDESALSKALELVPKEMRRRGFSDPVRLKQSKEDIDQEAKETIKQEEYKIFYERYQPPTPRDKKNYGDDFNKS
jgi:hypothetical protein